MAGPFCGNRCKGAYGAARVGKKIGKIAVYYEDSRTYYKAEKDTAVTVQQMAGQQPNVDEAYILRWIKRVKNTYKKKRLSLMSMKVKKCPRCGATFDALFKKQVYCSQECAQISRRKVARPSAEKLQQLVAEKSFKKIAKIFKVSDNTVAKWCRQYGIHSSR